ncbi:hypothetical protein [Paraburkholderia hospita]|jgi:hypothetical protein|uniref:hypothetical protein n=1 Tax=Paraburkholderia hospita TaxID=169430 RepID=UPI003F503986
MSEFHLSFGDHVHDLKSSQEAFYYAAIGTKLQPGVTKSFRCARLVPLWSMVTVSGTSFRASDFSKVDGVSVLVDGGKDIAIRP